LAVLCCSNHVISNCFVNLAKGGNDIVFFGKIAQCLCSSAGKARFLFVRFRPCVLAEGGLS